MRVNGSMWSRAGAARSAHHARYLPLMAVFATLLATAGCSTLPSGSPTVRDVTEEVEKDPDSNVVSVKASLTLVSGLNKNGASATATSGFFRDTGPQGTVLGAGDVLSITVIEQAAGGLFSASSATGVQVGSNLVTLPDVQIDSRGMITLPYINSVKAAGLTEQSLGKLLVEQLQSQTPSPNVMVQRTTDVSNTVLVGGVARTPGPVLLTPAGETLLEIIARAGGSLHPPSDTLIKMTRRGETREVRLSALQDRPQLNIRLQPDDIITLDLSPQNYTVLGAATSEASQPLPGAGLTLAEVIGQAGGLDDGRADSKGIYVLRHEHRSLLRSLGVTIPASVAHAERVPTIYQFDMDSIDGIFAAQAYSIRANDIVLIANAQSVDLTKAFRLLTGATQQVSSTTTLANRL